ncbi:MAG: thymidylate kinase [Schwartzia sp.]|nr:thymidylate kinase [Schwartzia sp. (in: firmicutes)]
MGTKGKLIILEAGDASGKETQTRLLYERLRSEGRDVTRVSFPDYASDSSALVRMYLRGDFGTQAADVDAYAASAFFAVDRYASFHTQWGEAYKRGGLILSDRYTTSNLAHQAVKLANEAARREYFAWLEDFEYGRLGLPRPDLVVFLDMPPEVSDALLAARAKETGSVDIHEKDKSYLHRVHEAYAEASERLGWTRIACGEGSAPRAPEAIAEEVYAAALSVLDMEAGGKR